MRGELSTSLLRKEDREKASDLRKRRGARRGKSKTLLEGGDL